MRSHIPGSATNDSLIVEDVTYMDSVRGPTTARKYQQPPPLMVPQPLPPVPTVESNQYRLVRNTSIFSPSSPKRNPYELPSLPDASPSAIYIDSPHPLHDEENVPPSTTVGVSTFTTASAAVSTNGNNAVIVSTATAMTSGGVGVGGATAVAAAGAGSGVINPRATVLMSGSWTVARAGWFRWLLNRGQNAHITVTRRLSRQMRVLQRTFESEEHLQKALKSKMLSADSTSRWLWDGVILICTLYYAILVPLSWVTFANVPIYRPSSFIYLESFITILLLLDVVVQFMTSYVDTNSSRLVDVPKEVFSHYLKNWFVVDILSAAPFDLILDKFLPGSTLWVIVHQIRLIRVLRVRSLFQLTMMQNINTSNVMFNFQVVPIMMYIFIAVVFVHWCTVIFVSLQDKPTLNYYLTSIYLIISTLSSTGFGDVPVLGIVQRSYAMFLFVMTLTINGWLVGSMTSIMQKSDVQSERRNQMRSTLGILRHFNVPYEMRREVLAFQYHLLHHNTSASYDQVLNSLPKSMRQRIGLFVRVKFVAEVPLFSKLSSTHLVALAQKLKSLVFEPEELIIKAGDPGKEMYFLWHGYADVLTAEGNFITTIHKGSYFGEIALLTDMKRTASIKALTYCDVFRLDKMDFLEIIDQFPDLKAIVEQEANKRAQGMAASGPQPATISNAIARRATKWYDTNNNSPAPSSPLRPVPASPNIPKLTLSASDRVVKRASYFRTEDLPAEELPDDRVTTPDSDRCSPRHPPHKPLRAFSAPHRTPRRQSSTDDGGNSAHSSNNHTHPFIYTTTTTTTTSTTVMMDGLDKRLTKLETNLQLAKQSLQKTEISLVSEVKSSMAAVQQQLAKQLRKLEDRLGELGTDHN